MFIVVNVTVLQQLLRAKSEVSSSVCIHWTGYHVNCGNGVEVIFVLIDDIYDVARVHSPVHHRNWQGNTVPYVASLQLDA